MRDASWHSSLLDAVRAGDIAALRALFDDDPEFPNVADDCGASLLTLAIYHGPVGLVVDLITAGAMVDAPASDGFPDLFAAIDREATDRYELLDVLVRAGADPNGRGVNDYTALHYAACRDDADAIVRLVQLGADPTMRTRIDHYATPLEEARLLGWHRAAAALEAVAPDSAAPPSPDHRTSSGKRRNA